jgi:large subunit ribosomal protein L15
MNFKRKKNVRQRGTKTHGWGAKKKHRGAGHRGGKGNAGTGKRGDAMNPSVNGERYFGKYGFVSKSRNKIKAINIDELQRKLKDYAIKGLIKVKNDTYIVNLNELGYDKLLGSGKVLYNLEITVDYSSANAVEKIEKAKGKVIVLEESKEKKKGAETSKKDSKAKKEDEFADDEDESDELDEDSE